MKSTDTDVGFIALTACVTTYSSNSPPEALDDSSATAALEYMVGQAIYYAKTDEERYDRMLATVYHSKERYNINASPVCAGFARWYERYAPDNQLLERCEQEAHEAPKGLWEGDDPMPPREWKRRLMREAQILPLVIESGTSRE